MKRIIWCFACIFCVVAQGVDLAEGAKQVILVEMDTGRVLLEKNADELMAPSSMAKIVSVMPVFERLREGRLSLNDKFPVSVKAWKQEGSRTFLEPNTTATVEDLLRGVIIQSGNDATTVLAESIAGSEANYAEEMTLLAKSLGAENTSFGNASGLPHPKSHSTARDLALLSRILIRKYPQFYSLFAEREFTYNKIRQGNRNPLLYKSNMNVDGIKTGVTDLGGYGIVASAVENGMRLVLVVNGTKNVHDRSRISETLLRWGFREFQKYRLFSAGDVLGEANVWLGTESKVKLVVPEDITMVFSYIECKKVKANLVYMDPIQAPIQEGQQIAKIVLDIEGQDAIEFPVVAGNAVGEVGSFGRAISALHFLLWGTGQ